MRRTNCLFFAIALYFRRYAKGRRQYIQWRMSDSGPFPHFLYVELRYGRQRVVSYKPIAPTARSCPPMVFLGAVRWGDSPKA